MSTRPGKSLIFEVSRLAELEQIRDRVHNLVKTQLGDDFRVDHPLYLALVEPFNLDVVLQQEVIAGLRRAMTNDAVLVHEHSYRRDPRPEVGDLFKVVQKVHLANIGNSRQTGGPITLEPGTSFSVMTDHYHEDVMQHMYMLLTSRGIVKVTCHELLLRISIGRVVKTGSRETPESG